MRKMMIQKQLKGYFIPPVILASPVSQPCNVAHSALSVEPAALWIAPSTENQ